ncbi:pyridoxal 5'-phosphate synthase glutaminase subunit PdxT [Propionibacterium sp.]|uniref:pyridoxal 5'-phosphate synthase glutaminase subunit PdxT n=1 Tax=Propionibacterium sp. TaxID=1977903 RepID=UPI0039EBA8D9
MSRLTGRGPGESPLIGVLALQGGVAEHVRALTAVGARTRLVRRPGELDALDGIVVPGGESSVLDKLSRSFGVAEPLRDALLGGLPALVTCAGLLLLAETLTDAAPGQQTLGVLHVRARRNAFGSQLDSFETHLDLTGVGNVPAVFIRAPVIETCGDGVETLASVQDHVVAVRQGAITALAFHPELTDDLTVHSAFVAACANAREAEQRRIA